MCPVRVESANRLVYSTRTQIPHYKLEEATEAVKPVMGPYYREPVKSQGWFPTHLVEPLIRSFKEDHYVADTGNIVFYEQSPELAGSAAKATK